MTKQEFETIAGKKVDYEEFEKINNLYSYCDLSKQTFCEKVKNNDWRAIADALAEQAEETYYELSETYYELSKLRKANAKMKEDVTELVELTLSNLDLENCSIIVATKKATECIGMKEVVKIKLKNGIELCEREKEYIMGLL